MAQLDGGRIMRCLREAVCEANKRLKESGLVLLTWGNVSAVDRVHGIMAIKPSGVPYEALTPECIVLVCVATGGVVGGNLKPSSDTPTHLELYRAFPCGGIAHTHSESATILAQACRPVRCMGTTQADYFRGDVPVTRSLTEQEVSTAYERSTGLVIVETFVGHDPMAVPGVIVANHGAFAWGVDAEEAVQNAMVLECVAKMEIGLCSVVPDATRPPRYLIDKHYLRKHGVHASYGQAARSDR